MTALRSLLFTILFYGGTVVYVLLSFPIALFGQRPLRRHVGNWARFHRRCAAWILGIRSRTEGDPPTGAVVVAAKHQSMFETLEIVLLLDEPAIVMKRQLADIPLFGWVTLRYGCIPVDRSGGGAALRRMMRAAGDAIAQGRPIVIFPEGTRVRPGERPPLQPGFAGLYRALKLPVVPLALDSGRLWPRGFAKRPGIVTMRFGETVPPGLPRGEAESAVHRAINALDPAA
ncbi:lysophospholipid acyltransferase family protein [Allosphingosinicella sp.]|jgi:1-acyl-sn-glycerol-3-phosphate acyltransferase|uniref:lysophospholipid acyltransferase family protein n=1 Tax=Allosphingosinicella sp. TaxID=2823234 RepID=UPI002F036DF4